MSSSSKRAMIRDELPAPARAVLEDLLTTSRNLHETLLAERRAITEREIDALTACGEEKLIQLTQLESLEIERRAMSLDNETEHEDPELAELWQNVLGEVYLCQKANEVNGVMVRTYEAQVQRALDLLAGKEGVNPVYEANGTTATSSHAQTIAKA